MNHSQRTFVGQPFPEIAFLFILVFGVAAPSKAQTLEEIFMLEWKVGSEVTIYGNTIRRLEGDNKNGVTNIAFINHDQVYADQSTELYEKRAAIGGKIVIFIARKTRAEANDTLMIIVKDESEKELFRHQLERLRPYRNSDDPQWYCHESISLPQIIEQPFFVYVIDSHARENGKFKFEVTRKVPKK